MRSLIAIAALTFCSEVWPQDWHPVKFYSAGECCMAYVLCGSNEGRSDKVYAEARRQALMADSKEKVWQLTAMYKNGEREMSDRLLWRASDPEVKQRALTKIVEGNCHRFLTD